jgi:Phytanoyl-CoA dioxygenase (PhyH)
MSRSVFLNPDHDAIFRAQGFIVLDLLPNSVVQDLQRFYETVARDHDRPFIATVLTTNLAMRRRIHDYLAAVFRQYLLPVLDRYRVALGSFAVKQAKAEFSKVALHQDVSFIEEGDCVGLSIWSPLIEVNAENGYLGVLPCSHRFNCNYREACALPYPEMVDQIETQFLQYLHLFPQQVLLMDNRLFHGSPSNRSDRHRVVAAGVLVPIESELIYCHRDDRVHPGMLAIYAVEPNFYLHHQFGFPPDRGRHYATVLRRVAPLTLDQLHRQSLERLVSNV